ncbi:CD99 antigen [Prionailurus viverrinus]|uniref:CD99 antigen n=1 Tax=Prionailurus viverrinus TaxID=61388 RepID=UPI001CA8D0CF|nr:CD99 antigen isoform X1 [Prionailurus bengalensis]XP_047703354.1 CD99 antigen [Prionailurus viverrinus]
MAPRAAVALLLVGLLGTLVPARGQDFDLSDALDNSDKKPTAPPKKPGTDSSDLNLEDALGGGGSHDPVPPKPPKPKPNPDPKQPGSSGGFSDSDLLDGASDAGGGGDGPGGGGPRPDGEEQADSPGVVPGIVGAVVVAVAGAISSFIAYQKKKLCFKENADQGDVSSKNQQSTNSDQPVQWTLLEK